MPTPQEIAKQVEQRAQELLPEEQRPEFEPKFIKECLDGNERGDGIMFASLFSDRFKLNVTPKDDEWYFWNGNVWQVDHKAIEAKSAVEECALEYTRMADDLKRQIEEEEIDKNHEDAWKLKLYSKYTSRIDRLRSRDGVGKVLHWAPIVQKSMKCKEEDFNRNNWLLPCGNGVIDLQTGTLTRGRPSDLMNCAIDLDYDPHADYALWHQVLAEITDSEEEIPAFLKRSFGYAATGWSYEQFWWFFLGPGRNGKGIIFNLISEVLQKFMHTINSSMLIEKRNVPSPSAASEHLYSLLGKRLIVGSETNKGQKIDESAIKELTGEDEINCRPNFRSEIVFYPTHTLMLRTNHVPYGIANNFAMRERLLPIEFPFMYVDDVEAYKRKEPQFADKFRQKDKHLKDKLRQIKQGILRWIVEGCLEWQEFGLSPPQIVIDARDNLGREEDFVGRFADACLTAFPGSEEPRLSCKDMYEAFKWWWSENEGQQERKMPAMKTVNKGLRERGYIVDAKGGITYVFGCMISLEVINEVQQAAKHE